MYFSKLYVFLDRENVFLWPESSFIQATFHLTITHPDKLCIAVLKASKKEVVYDYLILIS